MESSDSNVTKSLILISALIVAALVHVFNWNEHSFAVIPLKVKEFTGSASKLDYVELANICNERRKPVCVELSVTNALIKDPKDKNLLYKLAKIKMERENYKDTVRLMADYFKYGGQGIEERFLLSQALFHIGDVKNSAEQLRYILFSSKKRVHPDIARFYVKVLMKSHNWQDAQKAIMHYRRSVKNASLFLEKEYKEIQKKLRPRKS